MRIAIVHYHLHSGGVTRIIQHTATALSGEGIETLVLSGAPPPKPWVTPLRVVDVLGYDEQGPSRDPQSIVVALESAAREHWGALPDLWHVHNHSLGKNLALPRAIYQLARSGQRMLLQIHDFPEDGRPTNYRNLIEVTGEGELQRLCDTLYPQAGHVHYAVINGRDHSILIAAGFSTAQLHRLPNPVRVPGQSPQNPLSEGREGHLWLYPTRAIRRKNLGEFLLWAALGAPQDRFATTLAPRNPLEWPIYERWCKLSESLQLPVAFGVGMSTDIGFEELLNSAYALVTTSVAEGFGMAFLEPWLAGRAVTGRNLPEITIEFQQAGVDLSGLYERLEVPVQWIGEDVLRDRALQGLDRILGAYGRMPREEDIERVLSVWVRAGFVDFGRLDERLQEDIIGRVANSKMARKELIPSSLPGPGKTPYVVEQNRKAILKSFSLEHYGPHLMEIYEQILDSPVESLGALSGEGLLDQFLAPERLYLLRS